MQTTYDIAIMGGGASGLAAAITAARYARTQTPDAHIAILEARDRVGKSILKTGNGRCNFSNEYIADGTHLVSYRNASFVTDVLQACSRIDSSEAYATDPVRAFFEELGLAWRQEADGRRYPLANKASVVLDVLRAAAQNEGVEEICDAQVTGIDVHERESVRFTVRLSDTRVIHARSVIVACGGKAVAACVGDLLDIKPAEPVLGPVRCSEESQALTRQLDNIRLRCSVALQRPSSAGFETVATETGELLFRTYGVSGICIFDLSRLAQPGDRLSINVLNKGDEAETLEYLQQRLSVLTERFNTVSYATLLRGLVLPRVADVLCGWVHINQDEAVTHEGCAQLARVLAAFPLEVAGIGPAEQCQVYRGGLQPADFDASTLEAHDIPGLFAAGEALDIDGPCGGYNLHWAWASGMLAGYAAATQLS